jgi:hypothetical protein
MAKISTIVFGIVFLIIGIIGLFGGAGIVGPDGIFATNKLHDWVHILSGLLFLIVTFTTPRASKVVMIVFGLVYLIVALLGFLGNNPVFGFIMVNNADNWLHLILALLILWAGIGTRGKMAT